MKTKKSITTQTTDATIIALSIEAGLATLPNGETINLFKIQEVMNDAFFEHGNQKYADVANEIAKLTLLVEDAKGKSDLVDAKTQADQVLDCLILTGPDLVYEGSDYAESTMYIKCLRGRWKLSIFQDMTDGMLYQMVEYGAYDQPFKKTNRKMPSQVKDLFYTKRNEAGDLLLGHPLRINRK